MALIEIDGLPWFTCKQWWFSMANCECHNQMVDSKDELAGTWCLQPPWSSKKPGIFEGTLAANYPRTHGEVSKHSQYTSGLRDTLPVTNYFNTQHQDHVNGLVFFLGNLHRNFHGIVPFLTYLGFLVKQISQENQSIHHDIGVSSFHQWGIPKNIQTCLVDFMEQPIKNH